MGSVLIILSVIIYSESLVGCMICANAVPLCVLHSCCTSTMFTLSPISTSV